MPGELGTKYSAGCNNLIQSQKAHMFLSVNKLYEELGWVTSANSTKKAKMTYLYQVGA